MRPHAVVAALLFVASTCGEAAVFSVSNINSDGPGSLRQAIIDANVTASPPHRIEFGPQFPLLGTIELFGALPALSVAVEIDGADRNPSVMPFDPSNSFPLIQTNRALTLRGFHLTQGRATPRGGCVRGEGIGASSALVIDRMTFSTCTAVVTSLAEAAVGGAISWPSTATVTIADSVFQGNAAASVLGGFASGGAIFSNGPLRVDSSYFISNIANGGGVSGGAISHFLIGAASIEIVDSVFVDNHAEPEAVASPSGAGGALSLDCYTCTMQLERNFFASNHSQNAGAVLLRGNDGIGTASVVLHNNTFTGNRAADIGGALFAVGAALDVRHATFHDNGATTGSHATAFNSTISEWSNSVLGDVADGAGSGCSLGAIAMIAVGNFQHPVDGGCNAALPGITGVADFQVLGVDDGELMPVVVFDRTSPVVDGGDAARCLASDARGGSRPQDGNGDGDARCDAGAYEIQGLAIFADGFEA